MHAIMILALLVGLMPLGRWHAPVRRIGPERTPATLAR